MCGRLNATVTSSSTMALRSFVVPDGRVEIKIRIDENRKLSPREHLYVDFLFTQYDGKYCDCGLGELYFVGIGLQWVFFPVLN